MTTKIDIEDEESTAEESYLDWNDAKQFDTSDGDSEEEASPEDTDSDDEPVEEENVEDFTVGEFNAEGFHIKEPKPEESEAEMEEKLNNFGVCMTGLFEDME